MRTWLRPLPLSIAAMLLLAMVKLSAVVQSLGPSVVSAGASAGRSVLPSAVAAETKPHGAAPAKPEPAATPVSAPPPAPVVAPASGPSEAERTLLQDLRARREVLDARAKALDERSTLLTAAERGLSERLDQLTAMQARLEALDQTRRERDEANWRGLVKTYETMRPRDAAAIFNELEQPVLMQVLDRMKEARTAPILAAMQPERARAATAQLVQWRSRTAGGPQG